MLPVARIPQPKRSAIEGEVYVRNDRADRTSECSRSRLWRRAPMRVIPDDEVESIPAELRFSSVDFARYRADQWCQHGE